MQKHELLDWIEKIHASNDMYRKKIGKTRLLAFEAIARFFALPRSLKRTPWSELPPANLQLPWLPRWPALKATPLHHPSDYAWVEILKSGADEIRKELAHVRSAFTRARYDSDHNPKLWNTYCFYVSGHPVSQNIAACPRTVAILAQLPHNAFHVCFSAIEPGGSLHPHTGPTNVSLTAHLGLENCTGSTLFVADEKAPYRDNEVLIFDDSYVHWVENGGDDIRYTLMITFWHPQLSALERVLINNMVRSNPNL